MADSATTKKALGKALKKLVCEHPFSKISISNICELCGMNRKSFYYHFRDKYDLINWIFDSEITSKAAHPDDTADTLKAVCSYLYENREFYKRSLKIDGQNSLRTHLCEVSYEYVLHRIGADASISERDPLAMQVRFFSDGFVSTIERWLFAREVSHPDEFCTVLTSICRTHGVQLLKSIEKTEL